MVCDQAAYDRAKEQASAFAGHRHINRLNRSDIIRVGLLHNLLQSIKIFQ